MTAKGVFLAPGRSLLGQFVDVCGGDKRFLARACGDDCAHHGVVPEIQRAASQLVDCR